MVARAYLPPLLDGFRAWAPLPTGDPRRLARDVWTALSLRSAELAVKLRAKVPEAQWTPSMRAASVELVAERRPVVPPGVLEDLLAGRA